MSIERYSVIDKKNPREILLLKSRPCHWGICTFCDYIHDNSSNENENIILNRSTLSRVTGRYKQLEIINSGSCFELPEISLADIQSKTHEKAIEKLYFEAHYSYRDQLKTFQNKFEMPIIFKSGIETFDDHFRNKVLKKGVYFSSPKEVAGYFKSICLLVGIEGQTKDMIKRDVDVLLNLFDYGCINIFQNNSTSVKADPLLITLFQENFGFLEKLENIEVLWHNTDFGVGGKINE